MVLDAYEKIGDQMPLIMEYQDIFKDHLGLQEILVKIYADILEFQQNAIKYFRGIDTLKSRDHCPDYSSRFFQDIAANLEEFQANL